MRSNRPLVGSQSFSIPSQAADATLRPSGENATPYTNSLCPAIVRSSRPFAASQSSPLPDTIVRPSGEYAIEFISSECPIPGTISTFAGCDLSGEGAPANCAAAEDWANEKSPRTTKIGSINRAKALMVEFPWTPGALKVTLPEASPAIAARIFSTPDSSALEKLLIDSLKRINHSMIPVHHASPAGVERFLPTAKSLCERDFRLCAVFRPKVPHRHVRSWHEV